MFNKLGNHIKHLLFAYLLISKLPNISILVFNDKYKYLFAYGDLLEESGYPRESILGKTMYEVLSEDSVSKLKPGYDMALSGQVFQSAIKGSAGFYTFSILPVKLAFLGKLGFIFIRKIDIEDFLVESYQEISKHREHIKLLNDLTKEALVDFTKAKRSFEMCSDQGLSCAKKEVRENTLRHFNKAESAFFRVLSFLEKDLHKDRYFSLPQEVLRITARYPQHSFSYGVSFNKDPYFIKTKLPMLLYAVAEVVENACYACPNKEEIRFDIREEEDVLVLKIEDFGKGIDPDLIKNIFNLSFTTKGSKGRGLYLANRALEGIGSTLTLRRASNPTTFEIYIPRSTPSEHKEI